MLILLLRNFQMPAQHLILLPCHPFQQALFQHHNTINIKSQPRRCNQAAKYGSQKKNVCRPALNPNKQIILHRNCRVYEQDDIHKINRIPICKIPFQHVKSPLQHFHHQKPYQMDCNIKRVKHDIRTSVLPSCSSRRIKQWHNRAKCNIRNTIHPQCKKTLFDGTSMKQRHIQHKRAAAQIKQIPPDCPHPEKPYICLSIDQTSQIKPHIRVTVFAAKHFFQKTAL